jgi:hypothetical protein
MCKNLMLNTNDVSEDFIFFNLCNPADYKVGINPNAILTVINPLVGDLLKAHTVFNINPNNILIVVYCYYIYPNELITFSKCLIQYCPKTN